MTLSSLTFIRTRRDPRLMLLVDGLIVRKQRGQEEVEGEEVERLNEVRL